MILYHISDREIISPDIHLGRKNADFGWGFYLTKDKDFVLRWAGDNNIVNIYEFDTTGLDICEFTQSYEWFNYIYNNRNGKDEMCCDVVIGPIANDTIFDTLGIISSGFLKAEDALKLLQIGPKYTQVAIKSEKAKKQLRFISSEKIDKINEKVRKEEQKLYEEEFAGVLEKIV